MSTTTPYSELSPELRAYVDSENPSDKLLAAAAGWGLDRIASDDAPDAAPARAMAAAKADAAAAGALFAGERDQGVRAVLAMRGVIHPGGEDSPFVLAAAEEREANGSRRGNGRAASGRGGDERDADAKGAGGREAAAGRPATMRPAAGARKTGGAR